MKQNILGLILIAVGAATAIMASLGLIAKLMERDSNTSPTVRTLISTLLGIWVITLFKYWSWDKDLPITGVIFLGAGIVCAGVLLC